MLTRSGALIDSRVRLARDPCRSMVMAHRPRVWQDIFRAPSCSAADADVVGTPPADCKTTQGSIDGPLPCLKLTYGVLTP